jgi:hypothetical protein
MNSNQSPTPQSVRITHCERHGDMQETFVCEHLLYGSELGFCTDSESESNPRPDAWCSNCERLRIEHGGWNDQSEALIAVKLVCGGCYDEIKKRNATAIGGNPKIQ